MTRFILFDKGQQASVLLGMSSNPEKSFKRAIVCIKEDDRIYKIISVCSNKRDSSLNVFFPYYKENKAYIYRHSHVYKAGIQKIKNTQINKEYSVNKNTKLSVHRSGFVQLSGNGILSGIDEVTGQPRGVGVFSSPLDTPVCSGPTFSFQCWGLSNNFELLEKLEKNCQYIILDKKNDFTEQTIFKNKILNSYTLEFFIFPEEANKFVYEYKNEPFINHVMDNYIFKPGAFFAHPVIDIKYFKEVLCIFPLLSQIKLGPENESGYILNSPGGANNINDSSKTGNNFHLICPGNTIISQKNIIDGLEYKDN